MIPRFCLIKIGCNWTREIIKWNAHLMIHRFRSIEIGCNWTREIIKWKLHSRNHGSPCTNLHICIQKTGPAAPAAHRAKKRAQWRTQHKHQTHHIFLLDVAHRWSSAVLFSSSVTRPGPKAPPCFLTLCVDLTWSVLLENKSATAHRLDASIGTSITQHRTDAERGPSQAPHSTALKHTGALGPESGKPTNTGPHTGPQTQNTKQIHL